MHDCKQKLPHPCTANVKWGSTFHSRGKSHEFRKKRRPQLWKYELKWTSYDAHVLCNDEAQLLKLSINAWMLHAAVAATAACHVTHVRHTSLKHTCMTEKKLRATHPPLHSKRKVGEHVSQSREFHEFRKKGKPQL